MHTLDLIQIRRRVADVSGRHRHIQDDAVVGVHSLVAQIVHALGLAGAVKVSRLRVRPTHPLVGMTAVALDLFHPLFLTAARILCQLLLRHFLILIQPVPINARLLFNLCQILRRPGSAGFHMCRVRANDAR